MPTGEMKFGIKGVAGDGDAEPSAACGEQREDFFGHRKAAGTAIGRGGRETRVAGRERGTAAGRSAGRIDKKFMSILQSMVFRLDKGTMGA